MRPIVFHLADGAMEEGFRAFFKRENWHYALGCDRFGIDALSLEDIYRVAGRTDQALWKSAHEYLDPFRETYERAVIVIDEYFDPSPGAAQIRADVSENMRMSGWDEERFEVVVIEPMLEAWLWMESDHVAKAFGLEGDYTKLREVLIAEKLWEADQPKPSQLKAARDRAAALGKSKSGRAIFRNVFNAVSSRALNRCVEPGFVQLRRILQTWFPQGGAA
jgi:hypothetical protein